VRRVWVRVAFRVALAAGAGLVSLVVCSGVLVTTVWLFLNTTSSSGWAFGSSTSWPSLIFWVGMGGLITVAAGLSLPARALGAKRDHVTNTAVLSGLGICAFVFFLFASLGNLFVGVPLALMAIVATPLIGSLFVIREDYRFTVRLVRAPVIAGVAIYCASLLAIWLVRGGEGWLYALVPVIVASTSWLVVPAIVAALRPG
jgi:hypothetical protein